MFHLICNPAPAPAPAPAAPALEWPEVAKNCRCRYLNHELQAEWPLEVLFHTDGRYVIAGGDDALVTDDALLMLANDILPAGWTRHYTR